ncbi:MAG: hypothetical protein IT178_06915 [Acidobacteria bacterium]|nr:hypothetical protein [Acidobacteriota bacterium]
MTVNGVSSSSDAASTSSPATDNTLGQDAFMKLLITQLQNQDPTQPQADGEFLAQLATFSQLEQLQSMNEKLDRLTEIFTTLDSSTSSTEA